MAPRQLRDRRRALLGALGGTAAAGFCVHSFGIRQTGVASVENPSLAGVILGRASDRNIRFRYDGGKGRNIDSDAAVNAPLTTVGGRHARTGFGKIPFRNWA
jgi:hypothetical protein